MVSTNEKQYMKLFLVALLEIGEVQFAIEIYGG